MIYKQSVKRPFCEWVRTGKENINQLQGIMINFSVLSCTFHLRSSKISGARRAQPIVWSTFF